MELLKKERFLQERSKTEVIEAYFPYIPYLQSCYYVFVDDKKEELEKMETWCQKRHIPFTGLHFRGDLPKPVPYLLDLQKHQLITHQHWREDHAAEKEYKEHPIICGICKKSYTNDHKNLEKES